MQELPVSFNGSIDVVVEMVANVTVSALLESWGITEEQWNAIPPEVQYEILSSREVREEAVMMKFGRNPWVYGNEFGRLLVQHADDIVTQVEQPESLARLLKERGWMAVDRVRRDNAKKAEAALYPNEAAVR